MSPTTMENLPPISSAPSASARCRFLELRSQGQTYNQIAAELGVSRRTLFYWNQQLQEEVTFEETAELETLRQELLGTREARLRRMAKRLATIEEELDKRSLEEVSTARLFTLADSVRRQLLKETTPKTHGRANVPLSPDPITPSECTHSANALETEDYTPSPLPKGDFCTAGRCRRNLPYQGKGPSGAEGVGTPESLEGMRGPSARSESSPSGLPINHHLTHPSTPSAPCNDSANRVQPPSAPSVNSAEASAALLCPENSAGKEQLPAPSTTVSIPADSNSAAPSSLPGCKDGAKAVQPEPPENEEPGIFAGSLDVYLAKAEAYMRECKSQAKTVQPGLVPPTDEPAPGTNREARPAQHAPEILPLSPERLIGHQINFREVWDRQKQQAKASTPSGS